MFSVHPKSKFWSARNKSRFYKKRAKIKRPFCPPTLGNPRERGVIKILLAFSKSEMKRANENGFSVIRILQEDVFKNKYDWLQELTNNIEIITNEYRVQNIYMCKNDEYKDYL